MSTHLLPKYCDLTVSSGSRLHFGLYAFEPQTVPKSDADPYRLSEASSHLRRYFGGLGLMVQQPSTEIRLTTARHFCVDGDSTGRIATFAQRWFDFIQLHNSSSDPLPTPQHGLPSVNQLPVRIQVLQSPPQHNGLGAGTQQALTVGHALTQFFLDQTLDPIALARSVGRGLRSAVGTYGFFRGGLIVDRGKLSPGTLGELDGNFPVPEDWRILLITSRSGSLMSGQREVEAFKQLPAIPVQTTQRLIDLTKQRIVPAVLAKDFLAYCDAIYDYGITAGLCFESMQGGPFATPGSQQIVDRIRQLGFQGVGQSSWGPTLFCFAKDSQQADWLQEKLTPILNADDEFLSITSARNCGVTSRSTPP